MIIPCKALHWADEECRLGSRNKRSRSLSRRSSHSSRKEGEIDRKVPARRPGITERGGVMERGEGRAVSRKGVKAEENVNSGGEQSWISLKSMFLSWTILNYCRDGMERMRNRQG